MSDTETSNLFFKDILVPKKGAAYRDEQVVSHSYYKTDIDTSKEIYGRSRIWGDIELKFQDRVISKIIDQSILLDVDTHDIAIIIAIARIESGFNPDAAAGTTSASGLGQFIKRTGKTYGLDDSNRFKVEDNSKALINHSLDNKRLALKREKEDIDLWIYKYHHDGPSKDYGGLSLSKNKVLPWVPKIEPLVRKYIRQKIVALNFPLNLNAYIGTSQDMLFQMYYCNNEYDSKFGYYPISWNTTWHGGLHLFMNEGTPIFNTTAGQIVAARISSPHEGISSNNFILLKHEIELNDSSKILFYSMHMHLRAEIVSTSSLAWIKRLKTICSSTKITWKAKRSSGLVLWDTEPDSEFACPEDMGASSGLSTNANGGKVYIKEEFVELDRWENASQDVFVQLDYNGEKKWACIKSGKTFWVNKVKEEESSDKAAAWFQNLIDGKIVDFTKINDAHEALKVPATEIIGACGPIKTTPKKNLTFGEHFEIFSFDEIVKDNTISDFSELPQNSEDLTKRFIILQKNYGSFANDEQLNMPITDKSVKFDKEKKTELNTPHEVFSIVVEGKNEFAQININNEKRWVVYQWPKRVGKEDILQIDGAITSLTEFPWFKIDDKDNDGTISKDSMQKVVDLILKANPDKEIPENILKRSELQDFYKNDSKAFSLRHTYVYSQSEWGIKSETVSDERTEYLPEDKATTYKDDVERFNIWPNTKDLIESTPFKENKRDNTILRYSFHPISFLWWLSIKLGVECTIPEVFDDDMKSDAAMVKPEDDDILNSNLLLYNITDNMYYRIEAEDLDLFMQDVDECQGLIDNLEKVKTDNKTDFEKLSAEVDNAKKNFVDYFNAAGKEEGSTDEDPAEETNNDLIYSDFSDFDSYLTHDLFQTTAITTTDTNTELPPEEKPKEKEKPKTKSSEAKVGRVLDEMMLVNKCKNKSTEKLKGFVYVRSDKMKNHTRKTPQSKLEKLFTEKELKRSDFQKKLENGSSISTAIKEVVKEKISKENIKGDIKKEVDKRCKALKKKMLLGEDFKFDLFKKEYDSGPAKEAKWGEDISKHSDDFDISAEAQFLRFSANASGKASLNLKELKANVDFSGSATATLASGKFESNIYIPDKKGFNILEFLRETNKKIEPYIGNQDPKDKNTIIKENKNIFFRIKIGIAADAFVGASAAIACPKLEIEGLKDEDKEKYEEDVNTGKISNANTEKNVKTAVAKLEIDAFAGAQGSASIKGSADWNLTDDDKKWEGLIKVSGTLTGIAGASFSGKIHFGYHDGHIRCKMKLKAALLLGGGGDFAFDLGLEPALKFIIELIKSVDYHYVAEIADDLYEDLCAYKLAIMLMPMGPAALATLKVASHADDIADAAVQTKKKIEEGKKALQNAKSWTEKVVQKHLFGTQKRDMKMYTDIINNMMSSPPESVSRFLFILMKTKEESDYDQIPIMLETCGDESKNGSDHKLRWIIRGLGLIEHLEQLRGEKQSGTVSFGGQIFGIENGGVRAKAADICSALKLNDGNAGTGSQEKGKILDEGIKKLMSFGGYFEESEDKKNIKYLFQIISILNKNSVNHSYELE